MKWRYGGPPDTMPPDDGPLFQCRGCSRQGPLNWCYECRRPMYPVSEPPEELSSADETILERLGISWSESVSSVAPKK